MVGHATSGRRRSRARVLLTLGFVFSAAAPAASAAPQAPAADRSAGTVPGPDGPAWLGTGSAVAGERLFTGATRFSNGGPPCASCHDVSGLPFPGGGTLGPDLTGTWMKYGPGAMDPVLSTLFFPTMVSLFAKRPMTDAEKGNLAAFFRTVAGRPPSTGTTAELAAFGALGAVVLMLVATLFWRRRIRSVRGGLMRRLGRRAEGTRR